MVSDRWNSWAEAPDRWRKTGIEFLGQDLGIGQSESERNHGAGVSQNGIADLKIE
jgi:hypothetical protein